ncbi:MAG TPA: T9SS type A sorting domain-containing protein [Ignavibacteria bacterium]|nr:T9SS type A sorting domain-containing protein [Ignavibacteria bacterium]HRK00040.1 T9SS type A sorting domain-containing protein [Ignavibacteria bacterium]
MKKWSFSVLLVVTVTILVFQSSYSLSKTVELSNGKADKHYPVSVVLNSDRSLQENLIIWYDESSNGTLFAQKMNSDGSIEWGNSGKILMSNFGYMSEFPIVHPDNTGGAVIIFHRNSIYTDEIFAVKLDSYGNIENRTVSLSAGLPGNNYSPSTTVTEHGFIVVSWEHFYEGQFDIYAQAIDYNLNKLWNDAHPAKVCFYDNDQRKPTLTSDGKGGVFIAWLDNRNSFENSLDYSLDVYASRLDHDGTPYQNGHKGSLILKNNFYSMISNPVSANLRKEMFYNHNLILSDNNSFFIASEIIDVSGNYIKVLKVNKDFQIINTRSLTHNPNAGDPRIISDGNFGIYLVWKDYSVNSNLILGSAFDKDLNYQIKGKSFVISCENSKNNSERILPDIRIKNSMTVNNGDLFVNWMNTDNNRLFISKLNLTDESGLCNNMVEIHSSIDEGEYTSITIQDDKLVVVYKHFNNIFAHIRELNGKTFSERTDEFRMSNYPNPFNPTTNINFFIPKDGFVSLRVFDITGKEVRKLVNEFRTNGEHNVTFNAENLSSGAYFYRLDAGGIVTTRRMTILK